MALMALMVGARAWLQENPQHNPWAPLDLTHPVGWATGAKLAALRSDPAECRAVLSRSGLSFEELEPADNAEAACKRPDRLILDETRLSPDTPQTTCPVAAAYAGWMEHVIQPAARDILGSSIVRVEHLGAYNCRRLYGRSEGGWSEHATGNAIDIAAFVAADGHRVEVLSDWSGDEAQHDFLRAVRDGACLWFGTVLSPDYNAAHADHLHLDQADRAFGTTCR